MTSDRRPLRILHVVQSLDPADGGPPVAALKLATAQAMAGHRVGILSYHVLGGERAFATLLEQLPLPGGVVLHLLPMPSRVERLLAHGAGRAARRLLGEADVAHLHGVWAPLLWRVAAEARRARVAYVVMPHGMLHPWSLSQRRLKKLLALRLLRSTIDRSLFVHALNDDEARSINALEFECPVEVIPNGVFPEEVDASPRRGAFRARHPDLGEHPVVLFLSRLHAKKGVDILVDAFALLAARRPDVRLVVVGQEAGAGDDMRMRLDNAGLRSRTIFTGPLYGRPKIEAMIDADVYCLPSRQEGFSLAILEALGLGLPCVISRACHFPEVEKSGAGFVVELDPERIAEALQKILNDPNARSKMGTAGRRLVLGRFTWPTIAALCIDAYRRRRTGNCPASEPRRPGTPDLLGER